MDMPVGACAEPASEWSCRINISCTAGTNMYSLGVLACVYNHDTPSSFSFLLSLLGSPKLDPVNGFQRMSGPVWSAALLFGELPPGGGVGGKKFGFGSKETHLFEEEMKQQPLVANRGTLVPPCSNRLLIFQLKIMQAFAGAGDFEGIWGTVVRERKNRYCSLFELEQAECHQSKYFIGAIMPWYLCLAKCISSFIFFCCAYSL